MSITQCSIRVRLDPTPRVFCDCCCIWLNGGIQHAEHVAGAKHLKQVKKSTGGPEIVEVDKTEALPEVVGGADVPKRADKAPRRNRGGASGWREWRNARQWREWRNAPQWHASWDQRDEHSSWDRWGWYDDRSGWRGCGDHTTSSESHWCQSGWRPGGENDREDQQDADECEGGQVGAPAPQSDRPEIVEESAGDLEDFNSDLWHAVDQFLYDVGEDEARGSNICVLVGGGNYGLRLLLLGAEIPYDKKSAGQKYLLIFLRSLGFVLSPRPWVDHGGRTELVSTSLLRMHF